MHARCASLVVLLLLTLQVAGFADTPLVNHADSWLYHKGTNAPQTGWKTISDVTLDGTWATGNGGFGYADNVKETTNCLTILSDMLATKYTTVYMRKQFQISSAVDSNSHLLLTMDYDDGFIAWLDGNYLTNALVTGAPGEPVFTAVANNTHESSQGNSSPQAAVTYDLGLVGSRLAVGTHTLAIIGVNQANTSSDFIQVADLSMGVPAGPVTNTWFAANSPIVVPTNVTITAGSTLVIQPGTTVQFGTNVNLVVANGGILLAEGTSNAPIIFTKYFGSVSNWGNITINGAIGSPESRIAYASFASNARNNGIPCIEVNLGTAFLDHLTFTNPFAPYIHVDEASFVISDCYFPASSGNFEQCHGTGGVKPGGHGLVLRNFFGKASQYNDVFDFTGGNRPGLPIIQFVNNVLMGSDDDGWDLDGTDAWVEGNIFLHFHKNAGTPDSSSGVSGGNNDFGANGPGGTGVETSQVTVIRNIFFDVDEASDAKQGNFFTYLNNTIVHQTHVGGIDSTGAVVILADAGTTEGVGIYLEGNILYDIEQLTRNVTAATVTFSNNIMPVAWAGPGGANTITTNVLFKHVPTMAETVFTNWAQAQVMWDWLSLQTNSPAVGTGPYGADKGAVAPHGVTLSGAPAGTTTQTSASIVVGINRTGSAIPTAGFPLGSGYTHYKWRLDSGAWSAETPIANPILLSGLANGSHQLDVIGKNDALTYQDDPILGPDAVVTSKSWTVQTQIPLRISSYNKAGSTFTLHFTAQAGQTYTVQSKV
ncbi:MAG: metalloprotease protein, partial [Verrucomicrobiales bacterium]|nr:metalloprotease protein [Verrucomicrobiales bacterium]